MKIRRGSGYLAWVVIANLIVSCSGIDVLNWRFPYMYPVQQGNYINQTQLLQLKAGMTKEQVAFIVGNPVSQFMFNAQQWQYMYQQYTNDKLSRSYLVNLNFNESGYLVSVANAGQVFVR